MSNNVTYVTYKTLYDRSTITNATDVIYLSDSMFRYLDHRRMSSAKQNAHVFFYPGARVKDILTRFKNDPRAARLNLGNISKFFVGNVKV